MTGPLATFVVGPDGATQRVRFTLDIIEGSPNILTEDPIPPLNRGGLRRLAKTLEALADLIEYGQGYRTPR